MVEVTSSGGPSALSEERRLLMTERSKHMKRKNGSRNGAPNYPGIVGATSCSSDSGPLESDSISLSTSERQLSDHSLALVDGSQQSAGPASSTLTSTPVTDSLAIRAQNVVFLDRVTDREILDNLAHLYAKMITGTVCVYCICM